MLQPAVDLRAKIAGDGVTIGVLGTDHVWPMLVDLCVRAGLDYLIVDCEHGPHDDLSVAQVCHAGRLANFPVIIRTPSTQSDVVRRALDLGPCGLMFPSVETVDQLNAVRDCLFMPPRGRRRPGGWGNYWMRDFQQATWEAEFEQQLIILTQIENTTGLNNAAAIAKHEIVTAMAIGPYDLSASLGCCWDSENPRLLDAFEHVREAGRAAGKNTWFGMGGKTLVDKGWNFICLGTPSSLLESAMRDTAQDAGGGAGAVKAPPAEMPIA